MKRLLALAILLLLAPAPAAMAQKPSPKPSASASPQAAAPTHIWDHQKELGLTDDQVTQIKAAVQHLQDQLTEAQSKGTAVQQELAALVNNDSTDIEQIRTKWMQLATIQVDARVADLQTTRTIRKVLSPEQMDRWKEIQKAAHAKAKK